MAKKTSHDDSNFSFRWGVELFDNARTEIPNWILEYYSRVPWTAKDGKTGVGVTNTEFTLIIHLSSFKYECEGSKSTPSLTETIRERMGYDTAQGIINIEKKLEYKQLMIVNRFAGKRSDYDFTPFSRAVLALALQNETNQPEKPARQESNSKLPEPSFQAMHAVFMDNSGKVVAPSAAELKAWRGFYANIFEAAGRNTEVACEAIQQGIDVADGNNSQGKIYPINDPGSIETAACSWLAAQNRRQRKEQANRQFPDLPEPEPPEPPTEAELAFADFQRYAKLYVQPASVYNQHFSMAKLIEKPNGILKIGVPAGTKQVLDAPRYHYGRTLKRIADSIDGIDAIEIVALKE